MTADEEEFLTVEAILNESDRCDQCGAQAYVSVLFKSGELLLCSHHFHANEETIQMQAIEVHDESWRLVAAHQN